MNYSIMLAMFGFAVASVNINPSGTPADYKFLKKKSTFRSPVVNSVCRMAELQGS